VEETGEPGENQRPVASHRQTLSHNVLHLTNAKCIEDFRHNLHTIFYFNLSTWILEVQKYYNYIVVYHFQIKSSVQIVIFLKQLWVITVFYLFCNNIPVCRENQMFSATFNNISVISWHIHNCCIENTSPWVGFEVTTLVVIGADCTGSCKSNYHLIAQVAVKKFQEQVSYSSNQNTFWLGELKITSWQIFKYINNSPILSCFNYCY
jgi:hypothetical protein